ncbi:PepSY-associated TM helix domain-containing protein [Mycolicibacterium arseniciresistens]|uniref:PepSY domain-containing protein n=1 Tax=Mycolicibacterium arseniciresistens TaxID=3062257 RepID=A0ABT8USB6_9MYCO|nr:PepSY domain-containing protein [Mycolicibacterium arseniciresistens]MDO3640061.1 PepSY domain-containing protein [Mycolicibacterium arseniciresistens]
MTTTPEDDVHNPPAPPSMPARQRLRGLRPLLLRLHFYAGVFVGPFILIAAVTGLLYALIPQIDTMVHRHELTVAQVGDQRLPLSDQLAAARAAHPEGTVASIRPPAAPDETTWVRLAVDDVPPDYARTVFVDPYSGEVRGALTTYGQWLPTRAWFDELHRNLHLDAVGRHYSELAASWLWVISLAGLALWVLHRRDTRKLRRLATPDRDKKDRRRTMSWHGAVGVWVVVALLGLSITGITWSRYGGESVDLIQDRLNSSAPAVDTALTAAPGPDTTAGNHHHGAHGGATATDSSGADVVLHAAEQAGLQGPMWLSPPAEAGEAWQAAENKRDWPTRADAIAVDPGSGALVDRVNQADWPFLAKLKDWAIDAHMGVLFGLANQIALVLVAVGLITVVVRGYLMWWQRRPTRGSAWAAGRPPLRGTLRNLPPAATTALVVAAVAVGWFLPLFGLSLAAFLVADLVVGAVKRHKAAADA